MSKTPNASVEVRSGEGIERALRRFRRSCDRAGIRGQLRRTRHYEKPSDSRRRQERKLEQKRRRAERKARARQVRRMSKLKARASALCMLSYDPASLAAEPAAPSSAPARKAG